jgi:acetyltransferase
MAFIATARVDDPDGDGDGADASSEETLGVARAIADPDNVEAEFGIIVRSDLKGSGLGERLMGKLIDYLRARGTQVLSAVVLTENQRMLALARDLGFTVEPRNEDGTRRIRLPLQTPAGAQATTPTGAA